MFFSISYSLTILIEHFLSAFETMTKKPKFYDFPEVKGLSTVSNLQWGMVVLCKKALINILSLSLMLSLLGEKERQIHWRVNAVS